MMEQMQGGGGAGPGDLGAMRGAGAGPKPGRAQFVAQDDEGPHKK